MAETKPAYISIYETANAWITMGRRRALPLVMVCTWDAALGVSVTHDGKHQNTTLYHAAICEA